jgi:HEAT repeat protein
MVAKPSGMHLRRRPGLPPVRWGISGLISYGHVHMGWILVVIAFAGMPLVASWSSAAQDITTLPTSTPVERPASDLSRLVLNVVGQSDPQARVDAAVGILRAFSEEGVTALRDVLEIPNNEAAKLAVCLAIAQAQSTHPDFIPGLTALLDHKEPALREAAAAALAGYSDPAVTARLKEQERLLLEKRFVETCKQLYQLLAKEADRAACLQRWLKSTLPLERVTALEIIHEKMSAGTRPSPDVLQQIRQMLNDRDERVRRQLVIILRDLRQPEDAARVQAMLAGERAVRVREEIYRALGYLGDPASIPACVAGLNEPAESIAAQAAGALGRLAARGPGEAPPGTTAAVAALVQRAAGPIEDPVLREQVIEAMAEIADPKFLPALRARAGATEKNPATRQAALRGIGQIGDAADANLVVDRLVSDSDPGVRETAAAALGKLGSRPEQLNVLRERLDPKIEASAAVQARAWESYRLLFLRVLSPALRDAALESWAQGDPVTVGRRIDLLADLEKQTGPTNSDPQRLSRLRESLGDAYLLAGRAADAAQAFTRALEVLAPAESESVQRVAGKLLDAYLQVPAGEKVVALLTDAKMQPLREMLLGRLVEYLRQTGASNRAATISLLDKLGQARTSFGSHWARQFDEIRAALPASQPAATRPG